MVWLLSVVLVLAVGDHFFIISKMSKTSCFKSGHFINVYIINRTLHGRLRIQILSSRAESISHSFMRYFQHLKMKFVSLCNHVISFISSHLSYTYEGLATQLSKQIQLHDLRCSGLACAFSDYQLECPPICFFFFFFSIGSPQ